MTNQSFDNQIKQKIGDHESPVPAGVWEAIEQKKKKRRYPFFWWLILGGIIAGGGIGISGLVKKKSIHNEVTVESKTAEPKSGEVSATSGASSQNVLPGADVPLHDNNVATTASDKNKIANDRPINAGGDKIVPLAKQPAKQLIESDKVTNFKPVYAKRYGKDVLPVHLKHAKGKTVTKNGDEPTAPVKEPAITGSVEDILAVMTTGDKDNLIALINRDRNMPVSAIAVRLQGNSNDQLLSSLMTNRDSLPFDNRLLKTASQPDSVSIVAAPVSAKKVSKKSRWQVEVGVNYFMPLRQKMLLTSIDRTTTGSLHLSEYKGDQVTIKLQPSVSYTLMLRKKITQRLLIGAGIQYGVIKEHLQLSGTETNTNFQVVQRLENGSSGPVLINDTVVTTTSGKRTIDAINSYRFFDLPLSVQHMLLQKRSFSLSGIVGVNLGLYSHYNNSIEGDIQPVYSSGSAIVKRSAARVEFSTGLRLSQQVLKGTSFFAEPYLRFNAGSYRGSIFNNRRVHQAGVGVGFVFEMGGR